MSMIPEVGKYDVEELKELFRGTREAEVAEDERELWLQEIAAALAKTGAKGIDFLLSCMADSDTERVRAALVGMSLVKQNRLSPRKRAKICDQVCRLLRDRDPLVVAEAVDALRHLGCKVGTELVCRLVRHRSPYVVGSALRFFAHLDGEKAVPMLEEALKSRQPVVRQNAIDELDELDSKQSLDKIEQLLNDPNKDVRQAARTAVEHLRQKA